jgi:amidase
MSDLGFRSASWLAEAIRGGEVGCRTVLDHLLARVERLNPALNAVVTLAAEDARRRADWLDAGHGRGGVRLRGVPITVKDTFELAGVRTTSGSPLLSAHVPATDAVGVARLADQGAVIFGKTNTPLFAGDAQTYNAVFGTTNNPWDTTRTPGGSSGGSAAAVAAGLTPLDLGSDIAGSVRIPSHYCGVYGHKPSYGIIPLRGHIPGPPGTLAEYDLATIGPIARTPDDLELALDILAGPDADRAVGWRLELPPPRRATLREYRVAAWLDDPACPVDDAVRARLEATVAALRRAGVAVDERARPGVPLAEAARDYLRLLYPIITSGMPPEEWEKLSAFGARLAPDDDGWLARAVRFSAQLHRDWLSANETAAHHRARWAGFFRDFDVLLCPVTSIVAPPHDHTEPMPLRTITVNGAERPYLEQIVWTGAIGSMAHLPVTVAPSGRTPAGLPVGVQIVGPFLEDRTTIDFARRLADVAGGFEPPPGY